ncbi:hypothetical protein DR950_00255 [Kitasatospora xanthocidica]|uniref:Uncharacterized protein n=1 Tax=Kitasatospora xanthocidica TaxID=83382 RepID=A0A372ZMF9_9ACTN|nr:MULTISPECIES: hypothetical protein [Streptomycetaceae]OKH97475.1 hypothetical protein AMK13_37700 [Streptomyces sp. CB02056]RGD56427.1 hypothetical protein DR950_00255 [Kitasatospora xanthocidica]
MSSRTRHTKRTRHVNRTAVTSGISALVAVAGLGLGAAPAHATPYPPTTQCDPAKDTYWEDVDNVRVEPTVTDFLAVAVAPGTTGTYTKTLSEVATVSTTINSSVEVSAEFKAIFARVSVKVGFSVSDTKATTRTTTVTDTVNFNSPGYYGLYRGTQKVTGEWVRFICARDGNIGYWVELNPGGPGTFTTFNVMEQGTVACSFPEPAGTLRAAARARLAC